MFDYFDPLLRKVVAERILPCGHVSNGGRTVNDRKIRAHRAVQNNLKVVGSRLHRNVSAAVRIRNRGTAKATNCLYPAGQKPDAEAAKILCLLYLRV
jgi:hypothetical protein